MVSKITGEGVAVDLLPFLPWQNVLRLHRRDLSIDNPYALGARVGYSLGEPVARELLKAFEGSEEDRAVLIGRLYTRDDARWLAELLVEIEADPDDLVSTQPDCGAASWIR